MVALPPPTDRGPPPAHAQSLPKGNWRRAATTSQLDQCPAAYAHQARKTASKNPGRDPGPATTDGDRNGGSAGENDHSGPSEGRNQARHEQDPEGSGCCSGTRRPPHGTPPLGEPVRRRAGALHTTRLWRRRDPTTPEPGSSAQLFGQGCPLTKPCRPFPQKHTGQTSFAMALSFSTVPGGASVVREGVRGGPCPAQPIRGGGGVGASPSFWACPHPTPTAGCKRRTGTTTDPQRRPAQPAPPKRNAKRGPAKASASRMEPEASRSLTRHPRGGPPAIGRVAR